MSFQTDVFAATRANENFRKVLFTGDNSQLVVMAVPPGGEVGEEVHDHVEQTLFFLEGDAVAELDGVETPVAPGGVVVVTPGTRHNFRNTGASTVKLFTVYAPPNHIDGRVHATKADADADEDDEAFGHAAR